MYLFCSKPPSLFHSPDTGTTGEGLIPALPALNSSSTNTSKPPAFSLPGLLAALRLGLARAKAAAATFAGCCCLDLFWTDRTAKLDRTGSSDVFKVPASFRSSRFACRIMLLRTAIHIITGITNFVRARVYHPVLKVVVFCPESVNWMSQSAWQRQVSVACPSHQLASLHLIANSKATLSAISLSHSSAGPLHFANSMTCTFLVHSEILHQLWRSCLVAPCRQHMPSNTKQSLAQCCSPV